MSAKLNTNGVLDAIIPIEEVGGKSTQASVGLSRRLKIYHFNDLHNNLVKSNNEGEVEPVFAGMAGQVAAARAAAQPDEIILFFGCGDDHTGSIFDELCGAGEAPFICDPAYRLYSAAGVDAITLGNHDFDRGSDRLRQAIEQDADLPIFSSNIQQSVQLRKGDDYQGAAIATINGLRIGLFGLTTPTGIRTDRIEDPNLEIRHAGTVALEEIAALTPYCDFIILLSHLGFAGARAPWDFTSPRVEDFHLAEALADLTAPPIIILGGHSHSILNEDGLNPDYQFDNVWIAQAGGNGRFLGEISCDVKIGSSGAVIENLDAQLLPSVELQDTPLAQQFQSTHVDPLWDQVSEMATRPIAKVTATAPVAQDLTIVDRYMRECAMANFMTDAVAHRLQHAHGMDIAFTLINATAVAAGLEPGMSYLKDWYEIIPYADDIVVVPVTGQQIHDIVVSNAQRVLRPEEWSAGLLYGKRFLRRGFLHFSNHLRYDLDLGDCAMNATAKDILLNGVPLKDQLNDRFHIGVMAAIFEGGYGQNWDGSMLGPEVPGDIRGFDMKSLPGDYTGLPFRQELVAQALHLGRVAPETGARLDGRVRLVPLPEQGSKVV